MEEIKKHLEDIFGKGVLTDEEYQEVYENKVKHTLTLYKLHGNRKKALGDRVQVLRILVRGLHKSKRHKMTEFEFNVRCEKYLDTLLAKYDYLLENAIEALRKLCST